MEIGRFPSCTCDASSRVGALYTSWLLAWFPSKQASRHLPLSCVLAMLCHFDAAALGLNRCARTRLELMGPCKTLRPVHVVKFREGADKSSKLMYSTQASTSIRGFLCWKEICQCMHYCVHGYSWYSVHYHTHQWPSSIQHSPECAGGNSCIS
jgi:hypothetical protein